jgi:hypothetical protein
MFLGDPHGARIVNPRGFANFAHVAAPIVVESGDVYLLQTYCLPEVFPIPDSTWDQHRVGAGEWHSAAILTFEGLLSRLTKTFLPNAAVDANDATRS